MNKRIIITDSASDISASKEKELGIKILPFSVAIDDKTYTSRVDFTNEEFYTMLNSAQKTPTFLPIDFNAR